MKKLTDEEWQKVMDQTQGHKVARAIYESMREHARKDNVAQYVPGMKSSQFPRMSTFYAEWDRLFSHEKELFIAVAGDLFDNEVIEGGNALPKLYRETGTEESKP